MTHQITVRPSGREFQSEPDETLLAAGIRQGIGLPYGCKDGACGSCKCRKLEGTVVHGPHQEKALSAAEEAAGFVLTCCGVAQSDVVLESRQVTSEGSFPIKKLPARVFKLARASDDVMLVTMQLPASDVLQDLPDLSGHQVYACGAPIVVDSARADYLAAGLPDWEFYADAFTSEADKTNTISD